MAADTITRLAEDLLGAGMIKLGLIHLYDLDLFFPAQLTFCPNLL